MKTSPRSDSIESTEPIESMKPIEFVKPIAKSGAVEYIVHFKQEDPRSDSLVGYLMLKNNVPRSHSWTREIFDMFLFICWLVIIINQLKNL